MNGLIIGPISDKELHVFVFDLGGRRSDVLHPHVAHFLLDNKQSTPTFFIVLTFSMILYDTVSRFTFSFLFQCATLYEATKAELDKFSP